MACRLTILGSGSSGNCAYLETETTRLLVDAGFSGKQIEERMASIGKNPTQLQAVLISHEHRDHIQGLRILADSRDLERESFQRVPACIHQDSRSFPGSIRRKLAVGFFAFAVQPAQGFRPAEFFPKERGGFPQH